MRKQIKKDKIKRNRYEDRNTCSRAHVWSVWKIERIWLRSFLVLMLLPWFCVVLVFLCINTR